MKLSQEEAYQLLKGSVVREFNAPSFIGGFTPLLMRAWPELTDGQREFITTQVGELCLRAVKEMPKAAGRKWAATSEWVQFLEWVTNFSAPFAQVEKQGPEKSDEGVAYVELPYEAFVDLGKQGRAHGMTGLSLARFDLVEGGNVVRLHLRLEVNSRGSVRAVTSVVDASDTLRTKQIAVFMGRGLPRDAVYVAPVEMK